MKRIINILLAFCLLMLTACSKTNTDEPVTTNYKDKLKEIDKYVFEVDENIQYIFYYKDNIVTDFKIYVNFYDEQTANNSLEQYKKIVENDINVEEVIVDGKYIVIDYKKGYVKQNFGTDSLDIIKSMEVIDESN